MTLTLTSEHLLLAGVGLHLLGGLAKSIFHTPRQQAQIDAIEGKVDAVLGAVQQVIPRPPGPGTPRPPILGG